MYIFIKYRYESSPEHIKVVFKKIWNDFIAFGELPLDLQAPEATPSKGRPKGAGNRREATSASSTQRFSSQFEYAEEKLKKNLKKTHKKKKKTTKAS